MFVSIINVTTNETPYTNELIHEFPCDVESSYYVKDATIRKQDVKFLDDHRLTDNVEDYVTIKPYDSSFGILAKLVEDTNNIEPIAKFVIGTTTNSIERFFSFMNTMKNIDHISYLQIIDESDTNDGILYLISFDMVQSLKVYNSQRRFTLPLKYQVDIVQKLQKTRGASFNDSMEIKLPEIKHLGPRQLYDLISQYINDDGFVYWIPNEGNGGDALIALGTIHFFNTHNIKYRIIEDRAKIKEGDKLIYSGGGNLVSHYPQCEAFLKHFSERHKLLILPHTIDKVDVLKDLCSNVTIVTRDLTSYYICKNHFKHSTYIHMDMAFYLDISKTPFKYNFKDKKIRTFNCFRNDVEKTITNVSKNIDLPEHINYDRYMTKEVLIEKTVVDIMDVLSRYEIVNTNRLHMCIACHLLGNIKVNFFNNSYWKNKEVYKYSPLMNDHLVSFHGSK